MVLSTFMKAWRTDLGNGMDMGHRIFLSETDRTVTCDDCNDGMNLLGRLSLMSDIQVGFGWVGTGADMAGKVHRFGNLVMRFLRKAMDDLPINDL